MIRILLLSLCILLAYSKPGDATQKRDMQIEVLRKLLSGGEYSSRRQAVLDSSYRERILIVRSLSATSLDTVWAYLRVEDVDTMGNGAVEEVVWAIHRIPERVLECAIYTVVRAHGDTIPVPDSITDISMVSGIMRSRRGCEIYLQEYEETFGGRSQGMHCRSRLAEAAFSTYEVTIARDRILIWERDYDRIGEQIGGPRVMPYAYFRESHEK